MVALSLFLIGDLHRWWHMTKIPDEDNPFRKNGPLKLSDFPWKLFLFFAFVGTLVAYGSGSGRRRTRTKRS